MINQNNSLFKALSDLFDDPFKPDPVIPEFDYMEKVTHTEGKESSLSMGNLHDILAGMPIVVNPYLPNDKIFMVSPSVMNKISKQ